MKEDIWARYLSDIKNSRNEQNRPCITLHKERAALVLTAFEMMATGTYQIEELRKILYKKGLKKTRNTFWEMLRNPVYAGKI